MQMTAAIAIHMTAALAALVLGPIALWARRGRTQRPRLHRLAGTTWVALMLVAALSAVFIRDYGMPNLGGYTPVHLLVPFTLLGLASAFWALRRGDIQRHRKTMQQLYFGACVVAGVFTLLPQRLLGQRLLGDWLGLL